MARVVAGAGETRGGILAVMQPYLFPYVGYFQLVHAADIFVLFDDVNYIVRGWINRNRILTPGGELIFTLPLAGASRNKRINEIAISEGYEKWRQKFLKTLQHSYGKAPCYGPAMEVIDAVLASEERRLSLFLENSLQILCRYLQIETHIMRSSDLPIEERCKTLKGEGRILEIARHLQARHYINAIGGRGLYEVRRFASHGLRLSFLQSRLAPYRQFSEEFIPWLSIIDLIMFNEPAKISQLLAAYDLLPVGSGK